MSVEDLAADVGIVKGTDEFESFCGCVENILQYGCGYSDDFTDDILEKCRNSELDIAKKVVKELQKPRGTHGRHKLKWWQSYVPKRRENRRDRRRTNGRAGGRDMNLQFEKNQKQMNLQFENKRNYRSSSRREPPLEYERNPRQRYRSRSRSRSRSPPRRAQPDRSRSRSPPRHSRASQYSDVPEWPPWGPHKRKRTRRY